MLELIKITRTQVLDNSQGYSRFIDDKNTQAKVEVVDFSEISNITYDNISRTFDYIEEDLATIAKTIQFITYAIRDNEKTYKMKLKTKDEETIDLNVYNIGFQVLVVELQEGIVLSGEDNVR